MQVKFGLITDIHHATHGQDLRVQMKSFVEDMNGCFHPDFVVELGDFYGGANSTEEDLRQINGIFRSCEAPVYYVLGNLDSWSDGGKQGFKETVGINYFWLSFDVEDFHFVILDGAWLREEVPISPEHPGQEQRPPVRLRLADGERFTTDDDPIGHVGHIPSHQLRRLEEDLAATGKRTVVFCHYPIYIGPYWARLDNEAEVVEVPERYGKVVAVFTGHFPRCSYKQEKGINYFIMRGMGQDCEELGSYAKVSITEDRLEIVGEVEQVSYEIEL